MLTPFSQLRDRAKWFSRRLTMDLCFSALHRVDRGPRDPPLSAMKPVSAGEVASGNPRPDGRWSLTELRGNLLHRQVDAGGRHTRPVRLADGVLSLEQ